MTRTLPTDVNTAVQLPDIAAAFLLELELDSGNVNMWTGPNDLSWDSKTWSGKGDFGAVSGYSEGADLSEKINVVLSLEDGGDALDLENELGTLDPIGRAFTLYLAFLNADTTIDDVLTLTAGFIDSVRFVSGTEAMIVLTLATDGVLLRRSQVYRMDDAMQQDLFAGDLGLEFVTDLNDEINWGASPPFTGGGGGVGGDKGGNARTNRER